MYNFTATLPLLFFMNFGYYQAQTILRLDVFWYCSRYVFIPPMYDWVPMTLVFVTPFGCT